MLIQVILSVELEFININYNYSMNFIEFSYNYNMDFIEQSSNYLFKANNESTRTSCEICSQLAIKIPEQC